MWCLVDGTSQYTRERPFLAHRDLDLSDGVPIRITRKPVPGSAAQTREHDEGDVARCPPAPSYRSRLHCRLRVANSSTRARRARVAHRRCDAWAFGVCGRSSSSGGSAAEWTSPKRSARKCAKPAESTEVDVRRAPARRRAAGASESSRARESSRRASRCWTRQPRFHDPGRGPVGLTSPSGDIGAHAQGGSGGPAHPGSAWMGCAFSWLTTRN